MIKPLSRFKPRAYLCLATLAAAVMIICAAAGMRVVLAGLPSIDLLEDYTPSLSTKVFDKDNQLIAEFTVERRALIPLDQIPKNMQNAVLAMEDDDFYNHWGISPLGIIRAALSDLRYGRAKQGASTITQQLSKNLFLSPEKKIIRKLREIIISMQIESQFSKKEILQLYLNQIYFGEGAYGVQEASKRYFSKRIDQLTLADCALLAAMIAAPTRFTPFGHADRAQTRRAAVLYRMKDVGYITREEYEAARKEPLPLEKTPIVQTKAPYFVEYVRRQLEPKYGVDTLWKGGLKIYTTLDLNAQLAAEEIMSRSLEKLDESVQQEIAEKIKNSVSGAETCKKVVSACAPDDPDCVEKTVDCSSAAVSTSSFKLQGAFLAMDIKTGALRMMIGGRDYSETQFNRTTQALRQPGSTFKPFVWMSALMNGYTAASLVNDSPMTFYFDGRNWRLFDDSSGMFAMDLATQAFTGDKEFKIWVPGNYDGKVMGQITLRRGLELSRNLVSIYLIDKLGPTVVVATARRAGIGHKMAPVLSLGLGTNAVTMLDMVNAFATFANSGIKVEPYAIDRVLDNTGKVLEQNIPTESEQFSPQQAFLITNLMRGVVEQGTAMGARALGRPLAGKTGTSQDHRDLWFIGSTPDMTAAGWVGYDDFSSIESKDWTGGGTVVPWWTEIMQTALKDTPVRDFTVPDGITFVQIDPRTGKLALPTTRRKFLEAFIKGTEPRSFSEIDD
ncbi:MAG: PBP1A family penicillin-binding protein [Elusimicrobiaceae bacterium]|nr:PBP1A family penicillin-binding protein [Elusimicrobiaceae bacterium]